MPEFPKTKYIYPAQDHHPLRKRRLSSKEKAKVTSRNFRSFSIRQFRQFLPALKELLIVDFV